MFCCVWICLYVLRLYIDVVSCIQFNKYAYISIDLSSKVHLQSLLYCCQRIRIHFHTEMFRYSELYSFICLYRRLHIQMCSAPGRKALHCFVCFNGVACILCVWWMIYLKNITDWIHLKLNLIFTFSFWLPQTPSLQWRCLNQRLLSNKEIRRPWGVTFIFGIR